MVHKLKKHNLFIDSIFLHYFLLFLQKNEFTQIPITMESGAMYIYMKGAWKYASFVQKIYDSVFAEINAYCLNYL